LRRTKKLMISTAVVVMFCSIILNLVLLNYFSDPAYAGRVSISFDELNLVKDVLNLVRNHYVEGKVVQDKNLVHGAIEGIIAKLDDPYSRFMPPKNYQDMQEDTRGSFGGLGMVLGMKNHRLTIISPIVNTPAYRAGIQAGDVIVKVDDKDVTEMALEDVVKILRGAPDSKVKVSIYREGRKRLLPFDLVREEIKVPSIRAAMIDNDIGYAYLSSFTARSAQELEQAVTEFEKRGMKGFILDLRHNPGGLLEAAVNVGRTFLSNSRIVTVKSRTGDEVPYSAYANRHGNFPLIVLIDNGSASASEIVSGAVKDNKRGILVGVKSFGKGSVQTVMRLADQSAMALTTAYYYTPSGICIHKVGVDPDIEVPLGPLSDDELKELRDTRTKFMNDSIGGKDDEFMEVSKHDRQLKRAIDILKGWSVFSKQILGKEGAEATSNN